MRQAVRILTAAVLLAQSPLQAVAQITLSGTAPSKTMPGGLPAFLVKMAELSDRVEGWQVLLPAGDPKSQALRPEMQRIQDTLRNTGSLHELQAVEAEIAAFEARIRTTLHPETASLPAEQQQQYQTALEDQKRALLALERKKVDTDGRYDAQLEGLRGQIMSSGLDSQKLSQIFDQVRRVGTSETAPVSNTASVSGSSFSGWSYSPTANQDLSYPAPTYVAAKGSLDVPPPAPVVAKGADEETVARIAKQRGMRADIVVQAFREAKKQGVDYRMVLAVINCESAFNPSVRSSVGATGLMQLMPGTAQGLGVRGDSQQSLIEKLKDPVTNIKAGVTFLKSLWRKFSDISFSQLGSIDPFTRHDVKSAIAAYNAGPGAVAKYGGVPPYQETRGYVVKVLQAYLNYRRLFPEG